MTFKNALAGLPFGGGKSVIIAQPDEKTPALLEAFARALEALNGDYWTGEDINVGPDDIELMARTSRYLLGRTSGGAGSGDPSPFTALGCYSAMKAALEHRYGSSSFVGRSVALQGAGSVGRALCRLITESGGSLIVADVREESARRAAANFGARIVPPHTIYEQQCDIFAPCAMGATINAQTIPQLRAAIVCGVANNQLGTAADGLALANRGILYCPDYVTNAGGIINASGEYLGRYNAKEARRKVEAIGDTITAILKEAAATGRPTSDIADSRARAIIDEARED